MLIIGERRNVKPDYRDEANSLCGMRSVKYELACSCVTVTASHRVAIANKETSYIGTLVPFFVTMFEIQPILKRFVRYTRQSKQRTRGFAAIDSGIWIFVRLKAISAQLFCPRVAKINITSGIIATGA